MKKLANKLKLNMETLAALDDKEMAALKGGFTYSLSTGYMCTDSHARSAGNNFYCGYLQGSGGTNPNC
jgi:natural product precursor